MAAAPQDRANPGRDCTTDQPGRARLNELLRGVLPLRAISAPIPHQRLPDAVDPQEIQTVTPHEKGRRLLATHHQPVPEALRPFGNGGPPARGWLGRERRRGRLTPRPG